MSLYRPFLFKNVEVLLITELLGNVGMARIGHPLCCTSYPESMKTLSRWTDCKVNGIAGSHLNSRADRFLRRFINIRIVLLSGALNDTNCT
jgi:hypothetical protein